MPWYCTKHEMHSIDEVCPECAREPTVESLTKELAKAKQTIMDRDISIGLLMRDLAEAKEDKE